MAEADARIGGRYRLGRQLASGGMGTVWQGWDERLHRSVAVKKLHVQPGLTETERDVAVKRVIREARLTARLHHPSAVQVFDIVDDGDSPCLIMQYVPSRSLQEIVRENGPLPPEEVATLVVVLASGRTGNVTGASACAAVTIERTDRSPRTRSRGSACRWPLRSRRRTVPASCIVT